MYIWSIICYEQRFTIPEDVLITAEAISSTAPERLVGSLWRVVSSITSLEGGEGGTSRGTSRGGGGGALWAQVLQEVRMRFVMFQGNVDVNNRL